MTVLVTGASGFIALHIVDTLLKKHYQVIGTVRSQEKAEAIYKQFKQEYPSLTPADLSFEIVENIASPNAFDNVLKSHPEITDVLHTASPFSFGLNKPLKEAYFVPATEGTKNILTAIKKHAPQVKHVVITSSFAAIVNRDKAGDASFVHTEDTWNPIEWEDVGEDEAKGYTASKKLAERLARDFVASEKPSFKLTTVNPPYVLGPQKFASALVKPTLNTSAECVNRMLSTDPGLTDFVAAPVGLSCDVRDVALLHVLPLENEQLDGKRLFTVNGSFNGQYLLNLINEQFPQLDGKIAKGAPTGARELAEKNGCFYDTSKTQQLTGLQWVPLDKTIRDSVQQILDFRAASE